MTADRNFKRIVRKRMAETGESYAQARAQLRPRHAVTADTITDEQIRELRRTQSPITPGLERLKTSTS